MQINHYLTADDRDLYQDWLDGLRDMRARVAIQRCCQELERPYPTFSVEDVDAVVAEAQFYRDGNAQFDGIWAQAGEAPAGQHAVLRTLCGYEDGLEATHLRELCGLDRFAFDAALDALERHDVLTTSNGQYRYSVELMRRWVPLERWGSSGDVPPVA